MPLPSSKNFIPPKKLLYVYNCAVYRLSCGIDIFSMKKVYMQDVGFLHGCVKPKLILIHRDVVSSGCVKSIQIDLDAEKHHEKCTEVELLNDNACTDAILLISVPVPFGGAILIGQNSVVYHNLNSYVRSTLPIMKVCIQRLCNDSIFIV